MTAPKLPDEPTPRTNAFAMARINRGKFPADYESAVYLARQLERELTAALALLAEREGEIAKLKDELAKFNRKHPVWDGSKTLNMTDPLNKAAELVMVEYFLGQGCCESPPWEYLGDDMRFGFRSVARAANARAEAAEKDARRLFLNIDHRAALGNGSPYEEAVINAGTKYITSVIGFYSTGDRRFTIGIFNSMLAAALDAMDPTKVKS